MNTTIRLICLAATTCLLACGSSAHAALIANWKFDSASGTTATDSVAGVYPGTLTNFTSPGTAWGAGRFGNALSYDNGNAVVLMNSSLVPTGANWTASAWFMAPIAPTGGYHTLYRGFTNDHHVIGLITSNELGTFDNAGATGFHGSTYDLDSLTPGWTQLVAVGSGSTTKYFINGASVGTASFKTALSIYSIGNYSAGTQLWSSKLDDTGVFNAALTDPMAKSLYTLAQTPTLNYQLSDATKLLDLFTAATGQTTVNGTTWMYRTGLSGTPGDVQYFGVDIYGQAQYVLVLDNLGNGLATPSVPEPSSLALLGLGVVGLAVRTRRHRHRAA